MKITFGKFSWSRIAFLNFISYRNVFKKNFIAKLFPSSYQLRGCFDNPPRHCLVRPILRYRFWNYFSSFLFILYNIIILRPSALGWIRNWTLKNFSKISFNLLFKIPRKILRAFLQRVSFSWLIQRFVERAS